MKMVSLCLSSVLFALACRQGTEVGNGARRTPPTTTGTNAGAGAPDASPTASEEKASSPSEVDLPDPVHFLTSTCASPLSEAMQGSFVHSAYVPAVVVTVEGSSGAKRLRFGEADYQIVPQPSTAEPFAIQVTPSVAPSSCSGVVSQTQADGRVLRSVVLDGVRILSWTLRQGQLESFRIQSMPESQSFEFRLDTAPSSP
jgi:hypothetical protein